MTSSGSGGHRLSPTSYDSSHSKGQSRTRKVKEHFSISYPIDKELQLKMRQHLGDGPMRFGPAVVPTDVNVRQQLVMGQSLQLTTYVSLRTLSDVKKKYRKATDEQVLRIVQFCNFHDAMAYDLLKKCKPHYFHLTSTDRQRDIEEHRLIVPIPQLALRQKPHSRIVYFRPSRFSPRYDSKASVIDSLIYVLDNWTRHDAIVWSKHNFSAIPVTYCLLVHLQEFESSNYSKDYWSKFMALLQGRVFPVRVGMVLWVDAPPCFDKVWTSMKHSMMLSKEFAEKNIRVTRHELWRHLQNDFEALLPSDEFPDLNPDSTVTLRDMAHDYLLFQRFLETLEGRSSSNEALASKRRAGRRRIHIPLRKKKRRPKTKTGEGLRAVDESENNDYVDESESRNHDFEDGKDSDDDNSDDDDDDSNHDLDEDDDIDLSSHENDSVSQVSRSNRSGRIRRGLLKLKFRRKSSNDSIDLSSSTKNDAGHKPPLSPRRTSRPVLVGPTAGHPKFRAPRRSSLSILEDMKQHMPDEHGHVESVGESVVHHRPRRPSIFGTMKEQPTNGAEYGAETSQRRGRRSSLLGGMKDNGLESGENNVHRKARRSSLFGGMKEPSEEASVGSSVAHRKPRRSSLFGGMKEPSEEASVEASVTHRKARRSSLFGGVKEQSNDSVNGDRLVHHKPRRSSLLGGMKAESEERNNGNQVVRRHPRRSSFFGAATEQEQAEVAAHPRNRRASLTMLGEIKDHTADHEPDNASAAKSITDQQYAKSPRQRRRRMSLTGMFAPLKGRRNRGGSRNGNDMDDASFISDSVQSKDFDESFRVSHLVQSGTNTSGGRRYSAHAVPASSSSIGSQQQGSESTNLFDESQNSSNSQNWDQIMSDMHRHSVRGTWQASPNMRTPPHHAKASRRFSTATLPINSPPLTSEQEVPAEKKGPPKLSYFLEQVERQKERTRQLQTQRETGNATIS